MMVPQSTSTSTHDSQCLLGIVDGPSHMSDGGIKDAHYLALQHVSVIAKLNRDGTFYDMSTFD